jgi:hypothetical protein
VTTCTLQGQLQGRGCLQLHYIPVISYIFSNPGAAGYLCLLHVFPAAFVLLGFLRFPVSLNTALHISFVFFGQPGRTGRYRYYEGDLNLFQNIDHGGRKDTPALDI